MKGKISEVLQRLECGKRLKTKIHVECCILKTKLRLKYSEITMYLQFCTWALLFISQRIDLSTI